MLADVSNYDERRRPRGLSDDQGEVGGVSMSLMKYMSIKEFVEFGYLHEINRRFLHPLGLALEAKRREDGEYMLSGIIDSREDPEGICFGPDLLDNEKAERVAAELAKRLPARQELWGGAIIQPMPAPAEGEQQT
jgi:hypothetical protein